MLPITLMIPTNITQGLQKASNMECDSDMKQKNKESEMKVILDSKILFNENNKCLFSYIYI